MPGELEGQSVFIRDVREASQTYSKGCFGYPMSGGFLELDLVEAAFLLSLNRLEVRKGKKKMDFPSLFDYASGRVEGFDIKYRVFKDLRERGFIVKPESGSFDLRVYPRGKLPSEVPPVYLVCAVSERSATNLSVFSRDVSESEDMGKRLLYGVADEEGDITYYKMFFKSPEGNIDPAVKKCSAVGKLVGDIIFVFDESEGKSLYEEAFFGKQSGGILQLSLIEGCYLIHTGELRVFDRKGNEMDEAALVAFGKKNQDEFDLRLKAYYDLRARGLVVKTGFKYGTHFRVYEGSPDECHARYLVHAVTASKIAMWPEISRTVRLSGGVRKEILFCRIGDGEKIDYLSFQWFKP
ncbi:tRNA intron endonuclease [Thermoplasmatales archaeon BRNA1]|nr:tRNA intron endonuclease [Thermoplasmatales archaeon BRNA1]